MKSLLTLSLVKGKGKPLYYSEGCYVKLHSDCDVEDVSYGDLNSFKIKMAMELAQSVILIYYMCLVDAVLIEFKMFFTCFFHFVFFF